MEQSEAHRETSPAPSPLDEITIRNGSAEEATGGTEADSGLALEPMFDLECRGESSPAVDDLDWREQVVHRVETFRKRRSELRERADPSLTLDFEFEPAASPSDDSEGALFREDRGTDSGEVLSALADRKHRPGLDKISMPPPSGSPGLISAGEEIRLTPGSEKLGESRKATAATLRERAVWRIASARRPSAMDADEEEERERLVAGSPEISFSASVSTADRPPAGSGQQSRLEGGPQVAPVSRRFLSGLIDGGVLSLCLGIFGVIFWQAGGHFSRNLATSGTFAFVGLVLCVAYFGLFTAISGSTPGLHALGLRVSGSDGALPSPSEAIMRAAGYVFSASALMLGFIWAAVDSDSLSWHDRMSDTFITASGFPCAEDDFPGASVEGSETEELSF